ncbi:hypothetical protein WDV06_35735 [Streptomyces racemochromogenes]|uniref:Uncharacterized protein n=1 Tax=Streptomyces racemochromogenes TaxID=67353 RepID=A0ABW7PPS3_9ACTN
MAAGLVQDAVRPRPHRVGVPLGFLAQRPRVLLRLRPQLRSLAPEGFRGFLAAVVFERGGEQVRDLGGAPRPVGRLLGEQPHDEISDGGRHVGRPFGQRRRCLPDVLLHHRPGVGFLERECPGQPLVEQAAQAVEVGAEVHRLPPRLFGRHVRGGSDRLTGPAPTRPRQLVEHLRDAEVGQFDHAGAGEQYVGRFDVAVDDVAPVRGGEGLGDLGTPVHHVVPGQRARPGEDPGQIRAVDAFHDQEQQPLASSSPVLAAVVNGDHVGVVEARGGAGLVREAPFRVGRPVFHPDQFDGDVPLQPRVEGLPDLSPATHARQVQQLVSAVQFQPLHGAPSRRACRRSSEYAAGAVSPASAFGRMSGGGEGAHP